LDALRSGFAAVGLTPDAGGQHADGQTHNALLGFADGSYLELIAPTPGGAASGHAWSAFMNSDAGSCAYAIRSDDIAADVARFRQHGITVGDPTHGGRTRPDGKRLEWITAKLGVEPLGSLLPFLIQDITPRQWRVPRSVSAEGLIDGVAEGVIHVDDLEASIDLYRRAFDLPMPDRFETMALAGAHFNATPITLVKSKSNTKVNVLLCSTSDLGKVREHLSIQANPISWPTDVPIIWLPPIYDTTFSLNLGLIERQ
jgi:hypothetical protein